jgi:4-hydroxy-tetrahydrodipicolinate synthase
MRFEGTYVAMVTPFDDDKQIDEEGFRSNINYLIDQGVDGLVGAGTTGESATLNHEEHQRIIDILVDEVDGRVAAIAGTGSNATSEALSLTKHAADAGADGALLITPYYNKPQQHALVDHYGTIAAKCDIPLIAYNVPSRTGSDIAVETAVELENK